MKKKLNVFWDRVMSRFDVFYDDDGLAKITYTRMGKPRDFCSVAKDGKGIIFDCEISSIDIDHAILSLTELKKILERN
jgi:hypothetical protein